MYPAYIECVPLMMLIGLPLLVGGLISSIIDAIMEGLFGWL